MTPVRFEFTRIQGISLRATLRAVLLYAVAAVLVVVFALRRLAFRALLPVRLRGIDGELDAWLEFVLADDEDRSQP